MLVFNQPEAVNEWVREMGGGYAAPGSFTALGWVVDYKLVGGLTFSNYNGKHCLVNIALAGRFPVGLLRAGLFYCFDQIRLRRLTFIIEQDNLRSQQLVSKLGAKREATLSDAGQSGDLFIYSLFPEDCKIWSRFNEKRRRAASPQSRGFDSPSGGRESKDVRLPTRPDADEYVRADRVGNVV